jgi:hypothetical protein
MIFTLYILIILLLTAYFRYDLIYFLLSLSYDIHQKYTSCLNYVYKIIGYPIHKIEIHNKVCYINYNFSNKRYILYINNNVIHLFLFRGRLIPDFPYNISIINDKTITNNNHTDEDIIYAYIIIDNKDVDITNFCRMIAGPRGNFYIDVLNVVKLTSYIYKDALLNYLKENYDEFNDIIEWVIENCDFKIRYIDSFGNQYTIE